MSREAFAIIELDHWESQHPSRAHRIRWAGVWYATLYEFGQVVAERHSAESREEAVALALGDAEEGRVAA